MKENIGKKYNLFQTISLAFGIVIGVGIYFKTGEIATLTQNNPLIGLLAWIVGGLITILSGLAYAEFAGSTSETGGSVTYLRETSGDVPAFMLGWGKFILGDSALIVVLGWVSSSFIMSIFGLTGNAIQVILTFILIVGLFMMNLIKPQWGGKGQGIMSVIKMIPLIAIILFGLFASDGHLVSEMTKPLTITDGKNVFSVFLATLIPIVFSFSGWDFAAAVSGEVENAKKNVPRAIIISLSLVTAVYILVYLAFVNILPAEELATGVPFGVAEALFGSRGGIVVMICIVISALGALNGVIIGCIRSAYSLSIKGLFVKSDYFATINEKYDTPFRSGIAMLMMTMVHLTLFAFLGDKGDFSGICVVVNLVMNCLIYVGLIRLRKSGKLVSEGYKTPAFPLIPVLATITTLILCVGLFVIDASTTRNVIIAILFYASGLPVYKYACKKR